MKRIAWLMLTLVLSPLRGFVLAEQPLRPSAPAVLHYLSPSNGSQFVQPGATIALRLDGPIAPASLSASLFSVSGSASGPHTGQALLADDGHTVVFKPNTPFTPGERVLAAVKAGLATQAGGVFSGLQASFTISAGGVDLAAVRASLAEEDLPASKPAGAAASAPAAPNAVVVHPQDYLTFPDNFPAYTVTVPATGTAPGLLFLAPIKVTPPTTNSYLLIADDSGEPIFWQATGFPAFDFKRQPDGSLTYFAQTDVRFHVLDSNYHEIKTIAAANGYTITDPHDLQILPNGHALFMVADPEITSTVQFGGYPTATVDWAAHPRAGHERPASIPVGQLVAFRHQLTHTLS